MASNVYVKYQGVLLVSGTLDIELWSATGVMWVFCASGQISGFIKLALHISIGLRAFGRDSTRLHAATRDHTRLYAIERDLARFYASGTLGVFFLIGI